jgi:hypothetical protein
LVSFDERALYVEISFLSYIVVYVIASLITALKVGLATSQGRHYLSLFIAMSLYLCAESIWAYFQLVLQIEVPYPSIADVFYLGFIPFIGYHFYYSFNVWQKEKAVKMHSVILAAIISAAQVGALVYLSFPTDPEEEDFDLPSTIVSLSYFIGDGALLFVAIVILWSLGRKSVFLLHRILLSSFLIMMVAGDTGFIFHLYLVGEEEFPKLEWVWSMLWSISFVVLVAGLVWYNKISSRINLNIQNVVAHDPVLESLWNMKGADDGGSNSGLEKDPRLENELTEYLRHGEIDQKIINIIEGSKGEVSLLISIKTIENETMDKILVIAQLVKERNLYCRVLISRSDKLQELSQGFSNIATAVVQYLYKTLDDDFVLFLGGNSMLMMESAENDADPTDARQKTFYSNNSIKVLAYQSLFENCWVLPMVHEIASVQRKGR